MADETPLQTFRFCPAQAVLETLVLIKVADPSFDMGPALKVHHEGGHDPFDHGRAQDMLRAVGRTAKPALYGRILEHVFITGSAAAAAAEPLLSAAELAQLGLTFDDLDIDPERHVHFQLRPLTDLDTQNLTAIDKYLEARGTAAELEGDGSASRTMRAWQNSLKTLRAGRY